MLEVTIADTGRGIDPDRLEVIFERFYQEEGALRRTAGGTGLGLAICRQIVTRLGGKIWAESGGRDHGTKFHFTLPIATIPIRPVSGEVRAKDVKPGSSKRSVRSRKTSV
jgi:signal transduction histidine kinase